MRTVGEMPVIDARRDAVRGCLLGGAVGDALGAPVEFDSLHDIRSRFGTGGVTDFAPAYGRLGAITDDTQMTLFTAEGIVRGRVRWDERGLCHLPSVVRHAYLRWLFTQDGDWSRSGDGFAHGHDEPDGWLVAQTVLHARRAPGNTCLAALRAEETASGRARNNSKGCGGVMRAAPAGAMARDRAFEVGCDVAALTHGHPSGYLPAGVLAATVAGLLDDMALEAALADARGQLVVHDGHQETLAALDAAIALGRRGLPAPADLETLGAGWVGDEALAIGVACALGAKGFDDGVLAAVNHSGDSDSTGSIAGNLLGAIHGVAAIPTRWLDALEARAIIDQVACDLHDVLAGRPPTWPSTHGWWDRYPGW